MDRRAALLIVSGLAGCGRIGFSPLPEEFAYTAHDAIYVYNDVDASLTRAIADNGPVDLGTATCTIAPDLAAATGLVFDADTCTITGKPTRTSPATPYVVTATTADGERHTSTVTIRTAPGFYVDDLVDGADAMATDNDCRTASGPCSLRAGLEQLVTFPPVSHVLLVPAGTSALGSALVVASDIEIIAAGMDATVLDGQDASRVVFSPNPHAISITGLTMRRGFTAADGGGCFYQIGGSLVLDSVAIDDCVNGDLDDSAGGGASVWDDFGTVPVTSAVIRNCRFARNTTTNAAGGGGALTLGTEGTTIVGTQFIENHSEYGNGAAVQRSQGPVRIERSLFVGNTGGATFYCMSNSPVTIENSTFTGNDTDDQGAVTLNSGCTATLVNATITDNHCATCFFGAGIAQNTGSAMTIRNTIVARNYDDGALANCELNMGDGRTSLGYNLTDGTEGECFSAASGDTFETDPGIGSLANNGGPTPTIAIDASSPAYNAGGTCPAVDQRGMPRPARGACDIGAFEVQ